MSTPSSKRCVAKEWRSVWQWTFCRPALFAAEEIIFCKFLVESFPLRPVKRYFSLLPSLILLFWLGHAIFFCRTTMFCKSSTRNSGILKTLSLFPFACLTCPIFSGKFRSDIFRLTNSETRKPQAYIRLAISFDFSVFNSSSSFLISSFDNVVGIRFSFFGRLIVAVISLFRIVEYANLIAARKSIIDIAALSVRFSAMKFLTSSVVIWFGDFCVKSKRSLFDLI